MPLPTNPHIRIIVKGLIICSARNGSTPATVGMLDKLDARRPHHKKEIIVIRTIGNPSPPIPDVDVEKNCHLSITGAPPEIVRYQPITTFDRMDEGQDPQDFRWITSMEEVTATADLSRTINHANLKPMIQIDRGIFYTHERTTVITDLRNGGTPTPYGFIADTIGIDVVLPVGSTATFANGNNTIFMLPASSADRYLILIDRDCNKSTGLKCRSDFTQVYKAIGVGLPAAKKRDIGRLGFKRNDPEIPCLGGRTEVPIP
jgi:hypothetical protein